MKRITLCTILLLGVLLYNTCSQDEENQLKNSSSILSLKDNQIPESVSTAVGDTLYFKDNYSDYWLLFCVKHDDDYIVYKGKWGGPSADKWDASAYYDTNNKVLTFAGIWRDGDTLFGQVKESYNNLYRGTYSWLRDAQYFYKYYRIEIMKDNTGLFKTGKLEKPDINELSSGSFETAPRKHK